MIILKYLLVKQQVLIDVTESVRILLSKFNRISFYQLLRSLDNEQKFVASALVLHFRLKDLIETINLLQKWLLSELGKGEKLKIEGFLFSFTPTSARSLVCESVDLQERGSGRVQR
ncbi:hypothetical protein CEN49_24355 [Fischerella thermalis CCMEE 5273]|uniref:Uncharacterized protein n=1 Tax=Fischerella thermalis JSC-11 TaxID=741277 RepID=G6FPJ5_9CYAN|nr:hypothetical protein FJSC11DRAFT_0775 [Fischerella thermalis JSC-11]PLZ10269.1 hypothetical protein CBP18_11335 [Fischerella thermalis WC119]PLZ11303.1 hypothetical protein CBP19_13310 [Fischerella thermalis WC1110]PLZ11797.1 hypothetical protein CBP17_09080 [Fischerella thermalis WC114]PLZ20004.1 hypothetical protein CBP29_18030 [Fischerella thermalis WC341]PLZ20050.1 hypothetical protein CBP30_12135 [Fischerella thermalis WC157]PLZ30501.1 hypothetical protein CBP28_07865 [Fischerella the